MTQKDVAEGLGVSPSLISRYERGKARPDSSFVLEVAEALGVRAESLLRSTYVEVTKPDFRAFQRLSKGEEASILARVGEWIERYLELEQLVGSTPRFQFEPTRVSSFTDIEEAAERLRNEWGLGVDPIDNLTESLEDKGVRVCPLEADADFDALTFWAEDDTPVIAVRKGVPGDRQRFSIAHELGHLVLRVHRLDEEDAANRFAGAFLVPRENVIGELGEHRKALNPHELHLLKHKYGLSMAGWVYRAKDVGVLSESGARKMWRLFSKNGWRRKEPGEFFEPEEPTRMKRLLLRGLQEEIITRERAAELVGMPLSEFLDEEARRHAGFPTSIRS